MSDFDVALRGFAALDEEALSRPWSWRDTAMDVRFALYRTLEDAQEMYARLSSARYPESRRILALAQRAFGDLRGLLTGLPADLLDRVPGAGEWSLRETLRHILLIERRYAAQTRYALDRKDSEPVRIPDDRQPTVTAKDLEGEVGTILARIGAARADTNQWLGTVGGPAGGRPAARGGPTNPCQIWGSSTRPAASLVASLLVRGATSSRGGRPTARGSPSCPSGPRRKSSSST